MAFQLPPACSLPCSSCSVPAGAADTQQKGFYGRSLRKLESLLDKGSSNPLALDPDLASRLSSEQIQLLHLNRALLYYLSGVWEGSEGWAGWCWCGCWWCG